MINASKGVGATKLPWCGYCTGRDPDYPALVTRGGMLTYSELGSRLLHAGRLLDEQGVRAGHKLILDVSPDIEAWVISLLAVLNHGTQVVVTDPDWPLTIRKTALSKFPAVANASSQARFFDAHDRGDAHTPEPGVWLFTSGTTQTPKASFRSARVLEAMISRIQERMPGIILSSRPAALVLAPLHHGYGLLNGLLLILTMGGTVVVADHANPSEAIELALKHAVSITYGWPLHYKALTGMEYARRRFSPKWSVSSSLALDPSIAQKYVDLTGCPIRQQYGMTETGPLCLDSDEYSVVHPYCVGRPLSGIALEIRGAGKETLGFGTIGAIAIKMSDPAPELSAPLSGGWWNTDDVGYADKEGKIYVLRRAIPFTDERKAV